MKETFAPTQGVKLEAIVFPGAGTPEQGEFEKVNCVLYNLDCEVVKLPVIALLFDVPTA